MSHFLGLVKRKRRKTVVLKYAPDPWHGRGPFGLVIQNPVGEVDHGAAAPGQTVLETVLADDPPGIAAWAAHVVAFAAAVVFAVFHSIKSPGNGALLKNRMC